MGSRQIEQRKELRQHITRLPAGALSVRSGDHLWHVIAVRDVSPSGISLCVAEPLPVGQSVTLVWRGEDMRAEFTGYTAWCAAAETMPECAVEHPCTQIVGLSLHGLRQLACLMQG
ncbi:MAG: PilZ domain-containing protein [Leptothrix sp. (in: b-proteobacteria)]